MLSETEDLTAAFLVVFLFVSCLLEMYFSYVHDRHLYEKKDTWNNVYLMALAFLINLCTKAVTLFILDFCYRFRLFEIKNMWLYWIVLIITQDLLYWCLHTSGHYVRILWAMHVTHHSSPLFNLTTGFRSTVFEPLYRVFFYLPLAFMGFSAVNILLAYLITQLYGNMVHTQTVKKLHPILEYILVTPSHHRVHHASNVLYLDKNMGMILIIWDRMFGTFQEELPEEKIIYGLTHQPGDTGPVNIVFHEFKAIAADVSRAPGFGNKLKYIFCPPGWSHDGSTQTARVMQREVWAERNKK
jgi:sterol desaturase/sphingolipid hydroxylase (fatty acid hydroxylase superfamily)